MNLCDIVDSYYHTKGNEILGLQDHGELIVVAARWSKYYYLDIHHSIWLQNYKAFYSLFFNYDIHNKEAVTEKAFTYGIEAPDVTIVDPSPALLKKIAIPLMSELLFSDREKLRELYLTLMKEQQ